MSLISSGDSEEAQKQRQEIEKEYEIPIEANKLPQTFKDFLNKTTSSIIILIDGLNQLDESGRAHELNWLPNQLPINVKIIASTLEGNTKDALEKKTDERLVITPLTDEERKEIIREMPSVFAKTLEDKHIDVLLTKKETHNPLYLKVALEELRVFGSFDKLGEKVQALPPDMVELFVYMLERLEEDHKDKPGIVERLFCFLECSRYGLTSNELGGLLEDDEERIHQVILKQIRDYLHNRGELIDFFHQALSKAIRQKYLSHGETSKWHRILAEYFMSKPVFLKEDKKEESLGKKKKEIPNVRKLIEQPWQQTKQGTMWDELEKTLCDLWFVAKSHII